MIVTWSDVLLQAVSGIGGILAGAGLLRLWFWLEDRAWRREQQRRESVRRLFG